MLPCLRAALGIFHHLQRLWIFRRILHRSPRANHPNEPGVRFAGSNSFRMKGYRKLVTLQIDFAKYRCIVPRPAGNQVSTRIRPFPDNLAELGFYPTRKPAESKGDMEGMQPQITHAAIFAVVLDHAFPINRFFRIEIRRVEDAALDFYDLAEIFFQQSTDDGHSPRKERKFRRAANKDVRVLFDNAQDRAISVQIDTERLFSEQVFPCLNDVRIKLSM